MDTTFQDKWKLRSVQYCFPMRIKAGYFGLESTSLFNRSLTCRHRTLPSTDRCYNGFWSPATPKQYELHVWRGFVAPVTPLLFLIYLQSPPETGPPSSLFFPTTLTPPWLRGLGPAPLPGRFSGQLFLLLLLAEWVFLGCHDFFRMLLPHPWSTLQCSVLISCPPLHDSEIFEKWEFISISVFAQCQDRGRKWDWKCVTNGPRTCKAKTMKSNAPGIEHFHNLDRGKNHVLVAMRIIYIARTEFVMH